jgi:hypothetical protein
MDIKLEQLSCRLEVEVKLGRILSHKFVEL